MFMSIYKYYIRQKVLYTTKSIINRQKVLYTTKSIIYDQKYYIRPKVLYTTIQLNRFIKN